MSMQPVCFDIANIAQKCCEMMSSDEGMIPSKECWYEFNPLNTYTIATGMIIGLGVISSALFLKHYFQSRTHDNIYRPQVNYNDENTLIILAEEGNLPEIKKILTHEIDINTFREDGTTALLAACKAKKWNVVKYLIENGADVNQADSRGRTPLHHVASSQNFQMLSSLLDKKANPDAVDKDGQTPLHYACVEGKSVQIAKELFEKTKYRADNWGNTPLHLACDGNKNNVGNIQLVQFLAENVDVNAQNYDGQTPSHLAAKTDRDDILKILLKNKANPNIQDKEGNTPLHDTILENCKYTFTLLLENSDPNILNLRGESPLHLAIFKLYGSDEFALALIASKKINLELAVGEDKSEMKKEPLRSEEKSLLGMTPLDLTIRFGHTKIFKSLLQNRAQLKVYDAGTSSLLWAMQNNRILETEFIIKKMTDEQLQTPLKDGLTLVEHAAASFDEGTLKLLAERKILFTFSEENKQKLIIATMKNFYDHFSEIQRKAPFVQIKQLNEFMEQLETAYKDKKITSPIIQDFSDEIEHRLAYFAKYSQKIAEGKIDSMSRHLSMFIESFRIARNEHIKPIWQKALALPHPPIPARMLQALQEHPFQNIDEVFSMMSHLATIGLAAAAEHQERNHEALHHADEGIHNTRMLLRRISPQTPYDNWAIPEEKPEEKKEEELYRKSSSRHRRPNYAKMEYEEKKEPAKY